MSKTCEVASKMDYNFERTWYCSRPPGHEGSHRAYACHDPKENVVWLGPWEDGRPYSEDPDGE